jgi:hypothetical protein
MQAQRPRCAGWSRRDHKFHSTFECKLKDASARAMPHEFVISRATLQADPGHEPRPSDTSARSAGCAIGAYRRRAWKAPARRRGPALTTLPRSPRPSTGYSRRALSLLEHKETGATEGTCPPSVPAPPSRCRTIRDDENPRQRFARQTPRASAMPNPVEVASRSLAAKMVADRRSRPPLCHNRGGEPPGSRQVPPEVPEPFDNASEGTRKALTALTIARNSGANTMTRSQL